MIFIDDSLYCYQHFHFLPSQQKTDLSLRDIVFCGDLGLVFQVILFSDGICIGRVSMQIVIFQKPFQK